MNFVMRSGGQTGADLAGLWVGKLLGLKTEGVAPENYQTLVGSQPSLGTVFGLTSRGSYRTRTIENVRASDLTLVFSRNMKSPGTVLTINSCLRATRPYVPIPDDRPPHQTVEEYWDRPFHLLPAGFTSACERICQADSRSYKLGLEDENYVINVAGNATQNARETFEFTFMGLWKILQTVHNVRPDDDVISNARRDRLNGLTAKELYELALEHKDVY
jgi:hypothetical protein